MPNDKFLSVVTTFLLFVWVTKGFWRNLTWRVMLLMDPMMLWVQEPLFFDSCYTLRPFQQRAAMPLIGAPKDPCRTWGFWRGWGWVGLDGTLEMNLGVPTLRSQKLWFWQDGESILKSKTLPLHFWEAIAHFFLYLVNGYDSEGSQHKSWTKPWNCHVIARLSGNLIGRMTVITEPIQKCLPRVLLWVLPWPQTWTLLARPPHMGLGGKYGIWFVWEILATERILFWYAVVKIFLFSNTGKLYRYISRAFIVNWPGRSHCDATAKGIGMWGPRSGDPLCEDPVGSIQEDGGKPKEFQEGKAGWDLRAFDELVFPFKTIVWTVNNDLKFFFWAATAFL